MIKAPNTLLIAAAGKRNCSCSHQPMRPIWVVQNSPHTKMIKWPKNHSKIVIEDLNVSGMLANRKLAKAVQDMGFYEFRRQLEYKTKLFGSDLIIADRWFASSKTCSNCGHKKEILSLNERVFECEKCSFICDRDLNASLMLASLAVSSTVSACGLVSADTARMKQEDNIKSTYGRFE